MAILIKPSTATKSLLVKPSTALASLSDKIPIIRDGLVFYAPLWSPQNQGASFKSREGLAHSCTVTGAIWGVQGRTFDGTDYYINCGNSQNLKPSSAITLIIWAKMDDITANEGLVYRGGFAGNQGIYQINHDGITVTFKLNDDDALCAYNETRDTNWHMWAATYDSINMFLYDNAVQKATLPYSTAIGADANNTLIGAYYSSDYTFDGTIGEVLIYNLALSAAELMHNYLSTRWRYK